MTFGIGSIIGSGIFLGSAIAIQSAGPSVLLAYLVSGFVISQVLGAMTAISINRPVTGSFKVYAEQYLGKFVGFTLGWMLYVSSILVIASEAVAAGIFLQYWFPNVPSAVFSVSAVAVAALVNRLNMESFSIAESIMAVLKLLVLVFFVGVGIHFLAANGITATPSPFGSAADFFPNGAAGLLQSMLITVFTYAGISTIAMATSKVRNPEKTIPKSTVIFLAAIALLYLATVFVIVTTTNWSTVSTDVSPLVQSLGVMGYAWASSLVNAAMLTAVVSVMFGSFFSSTQIMMSLSEAKEAPASLDRTNAKGIDNRAWALTAAVAVGLVGVSFAFGSVYFKYLVSASSYISFFSWFINLIVYLKWQKEKGPDETQTSPLILGRAGAYVTMTLIAALAVLSLWAHDFRIGFSFAAGMMAVVCICYRIFVYPKR
ncbi:MAG: amino acid permease [Anaerofustis sp.]